MKLICLIIIQFIIFTNLNLKSTLAFEKFTLSPSSQIHKLFYKIKMPHGSGNFPIFILPRSIGAGGAGYIRTFSKTESKIALCYDFKKIKRNLNINTIVRSFDIKDTENIKVKRISSGYLGNVFLIKTGKEFEKKYILKSSPYYTEKRINSFQNLTEYLRNQNFPSIKLIQDKNLNYFVKKNNKYYILYDYIKGLSLKIKAIEDFNNSDTTERFHLLAKILNNYYKITKDFVFKEELEQPFFSIWNCKNWENKIQEISKNTTDIHIKNFFTNNLEKIKSHIQKISNLYYSEKFNEIPDYYIHGDFKPENILVKDGFTGLIDFDNVMKGKRIYDILFASLVIFNSFDINEFFKKEKYIIDFFRIFDLYFDLSQEEIDIIPEIFRVILLYRLLIIPQSHNLPTLKILNTDINSLEKLNEKDIQLNWKKFISNFKKEKGKVYEKDFMSIINNKDLISTLRKRLGNEGDLNAKKAINERFKNNTFIKLMILDYDGTIALPGKKISNNMQKILENLLDQHLHIAIITGRKNNFIHENFVTLFPKKYWPQLHVFEDGGASSYTYQKSKKNILKINYKSVNINSLQKTNITIFLKNIMTEYFKKELMFNKINTGLSSLSFHLKELTTLNILEKQKIIDLLRENIISKHIINKPIFISLSYDSIEISFKDKGKAAKYLFSKLKKKGILKNEKEILIAGDSIYPFENDYPMFKIFKDALCLTTSKELLFQDLKILYTKEDAPNGLETIFSYINKINKIHLGNFSFLEEFGSLLNSWIYILENNIFSYPLLCFFSKLFTDSDISLNSNSKRFLNIETINNKYEIISVYKMNKFRKNTLNAICWIYSGLKFGNSVCIDFCADKIIEKIKKKLLKINSAEYVITSAPTTGHINSSQCITKKIADKLGIEYIKIIKTSFFDPKSNNLFSENLTPTYSEMQIKNKEEILKKTIIDHGKILKRKFRNKNVIIIDDGIVSGSMLKQIISVLNKNKVKDIHAFVFMDMPINDEKIEKKLLFLLFHELGINTLIKTINSKDWHIVTSFLWLLKELEPQILKQLFKEISENKKKKIIKELKFYYRGQEDILDFFKKVLTSEFKEINKITNKLKRVEQKQNLLNSQT